MAIEYNGITFTDEMIENIRNALLIFAEAAEAVIKKKEAFDSMSDEERRHWINIFNQWGRLGWIKPLQMPISIFKEIPNTKEEADIKAIEYCKEEYLEHEWESTRKNRWYHEFDYDFEEAITAYKNQMYKSCALLLVSMIDGSLIRFQKGNDDPQVCAAAISNFQSNVYKETVINDWLDSKSSLSGLNRALGVVFDSVKFLESDTEIINRNLLVHGAMKRAVNKVDCIQLFLIYRELSNMILYYACNQKKYL